MTIKMVNSDRVSVLAEDLRYAAAHLGYIPLQHGVGLSTGKGHFFVLADQEGNRYSVEIKGEVKA